MIKHGNEILDMPSGTISTIGNSGIVRLYYKELETAFDAVIDAIDTALQECDNFSDIFSDKK